MDHDAAILSDLPEVEPTSTFLSRLLIRTLRHSVTEGNEEYVLSIPGRRQSTVIVEINGHSRKIGNSNKRNRKGTFTTVGQLV